MSAADEQAETRTEWGVRSATGRLYAYRQDRRAAQNAVAMCWSRAQAHTDTPCCTLVTRTVQVGPWEPVTS